MNELEAAKDRVEDADLTLIGIQSLPYSLYGDIMFDRDEKAEALEQIRTLVRNLGEADIPILGYQWNPRGVVPMRTGTAELRGGARGTAFEYDALSSPDELAPGLDRTYTEDEFWEHYESFLESMCGIPRLCRNVENFERAMSAVSSDSHSLKLCLGCFSQMGEDVTEVVRIFGERDQIGFIHFRGVVGGVPQFHETFVDDGNFDPCEVVETLDEIGYDGVVIPDHVPEMAGDTDWRHRARGYTVGYLRGVIDSVQSDPS